MSQSVQRGRAHRLSQLMAQPFPVTHQVTAMGEASEQPLTWGTFQRQVAQITEQVQAQEARRWLLCTKRPSWFAVGFFGLLHAGKQIILPANGQEGTITSLKDHFDAALTDFPVQIEHAHLPTLTQTRATPPPLPSITSAEAASVSLFTSGSTGAPKCIHKTLSQLEEEVLVLESMWGQDADDAVVFATVSHQHIYGLLFRVLWPLAAGRRFGDHSFLSPAALLQAINQRQTPAILVSTPTHYKQLLEWLTPEEQRAAQSHLRLCFSSGGPLAAEVAYKLEERWGAPPLEVLGSSETGGVAWRRQTKASQDTRWAPMEQVSARAGDDGTLYVRSPFTPVGADTWYQMDDLASFDETGRFWLKGRKDRVAKIAEKRVSLVALEEALCQHPYVEDCAVVVLPGQGTRHIIGAVVILTQRGQRQYEAEGAFSLHKTFRTALVTTFEPVTLPRRWRYVTSLPTNTQGKREQEAIVALFTSDDPTHDTSDTHK